MLNLRACQWWTFSFLVHPEKSVHEPSPVTHNCMQQLWLLSNTMTKLVIPPLADILQCVRHFTPVLAEITSLFQPWLDTGSPNPSPPHAHPLHPSAPMPISRPFDSFWSPASATRSVKVVPTSLLSSFHTSVSGPFWSNHHVLDSSPVHVTSSLNQLNTFMCPNCHVRILNYLHMSSLERLQNTSGKSEFASEVLLTSANSTLYF